MATSINISDCREALYNDHAVGLASRIQLPREAVTRLWGLVVDFDANILKPNPWFPPADTAEAFFRRIEPALGRHQVLRYAEIRDTGRWLHAIVRFKEPVELKSAKDQQCWTAIHKVLMASVPADPSAPALIALTRQIGSVNSKTGNAVRMLKQAVEIPASLVTDWTEEVSHNPFRTLGRVFFGDERVTPCPYCTAPDSHFDLGDFVGFCYGPCQRIQTKRLHEPFFATAPTADSPICNESGAVSVGMQAVQAKSKKKRTTEMPVIVIDRDSVLEIDPGKVNTISIKLKQPTVPETK